MEIYKKLSSIVKKYPKPVIALGMFDGVHIGHASIIRRAVELAKSIGGTSMVFTFSNHPLSILAPENQPLAIGNRSLRRKLVGEIGIDVLIDIPFTKELSRRSPDEFLQLLKDKFAPSIVVTGPNYTFGRFGKGNGRMLLRESEAYGFRAEVCPAITVNRKTVSSTRIRALIKDGELDSANELLGRPFTYVSTVVHGERRGRKLGFPTANLEIAEGRAMLPNGAYAVRVSIDDKNYCGIANVGNNPTFGAVKRRLEVYIDQFNGDLYGRELGVEFLKQLRAEQTFSGATELAAQLRADLERAQKFFSNIN